LIAANWFGDDGSHMGRIIVALIVLAILEVAAFLIAVPRLNWSALEKPSAIEDRVAEYALGGWIDRNASNEKNPLQPTADSLKAGQAEYDEHCAFCHGLDGSGRNRIEASFYPPIPKLTGEAEETSDGQMFFIIAKGIRYSAMPGFEKNHQPDEIWRMMLWVRHLDKLTPVEKSAIEGKMKGGPEAEHHH